jgi:pimeloyl-ACP methyl ester carboxylesterase
MWDRVVDRLTHDELHLVTYDVRGAGSSDAPSDVRDYRTELLVRDLMAVVAATVPEGGRVHLVGHDWGSVQLWDAVDSARGDPRLSDRIASFTSISGPSLDHLSRLARRSRGRQLRALRQLLHSWYIFLFLVPRLPELLLRRLHRQISRAISRVEGFDAPAWGPGLADDGAHGVNLYRANIVRRIRGRGVLHTDVPVLVVHPEKDRYLTPYVHEDLEEECSDLQLVTIRSGHWAARSVPDEVAALIHRHVAAHA